MPKFAPVANSLTAKAVPPSLKGREPEGRVNLHDTLGNKFRYGEYKCSFVALSMH